MEQLGNKIGKAIQPILDEYAVSGSGISEEALKAKIEIVKRTNRRRQAWTALLSMIVVTILLMFGVSETKIQILKDVLPFFYITMASIVGAYHGFSAWLGKGQ